MKASFLSGSLISSKGFASPATRSQPPKDLLAKRRPVQPTAPVSTTTRSPDVMSDISVQESILSRPASRQPKLKKPTASSLQTFKAESEKLKKDNTGRVRMSVRMSSDEHLQLKLLAAHSKKSAQCIIEEALSEYVANHGDEILPEACSCIRKKTYS
ncbi:hypothetical protein A9Q83_17110 [Alphaproteobacteria bacterium 46_93_T64]|nr:hypothetical protein A9Q83_17110 [Alphaproteobacteria bacterium 46_93_T64]